MQRSKYQSVIKSSAIYDLVFTFAFAIPGLALLKINLLFDAHSGFNLLGSFPAFDPVHLMFVNLLGVIVTIWSVLRIRYPEPILGLYDAYARFGFSFIMAVTLFYYQGTELILFFLIPEFLWGIYQWYGYQKVKNSTKENTIFSMTN